MIFWYSCPPPFSTSLSIERGKSNYFQSWDILCQQYACQYPAPEPYIQGPDMLQMLSGTGPSRRNPNLI